MSVDLATLAIAFETRGHEQAKRALDDVAKAGQRAETGTKGAAQGAAGAARPMVELSGTSNVLASRLKEVAASGQRAEAGAKGAGQGSAVATRSFNDLSTVSGLLSSRLLGVGVSIVGVGTAFVKAVSMIDSYKRTVIGIAATLTDTVSGSDAEMRAAYESNVRYAEQTYSRVEAAAAKFFASGQEMISAWKTLSMKGVTLTSDEDINNLGIIVDKVKLLTEGQSSGLQIAQELRAMMNGQARAGSELGQIMKDKLGPEWEKQVKLAAQQGKLLELVASQFKGLKYASEDVQDTVEAQLSTMSTYLGQMVRSGFKEMWQDVVSLLKTVNSLLEDTKGSISSVVSETYGAFRKAVTSIPRDLLLAYSYMKHGFNKDNPDFQTSRDKIISFYAPQKKDEQVDGQASPVFTPPKVGPDADDLKKAHAQDGLRLQFESAKLQVSDYERGYANKIAGLEAETTGNTFSRDLLRAQIDAENDVQARLEKRIELSKLKNQLSKEGLTAEASGVDALIGKLDGMIVQEQRLNELRAEQLDQEKKRRLLREATDHTEKMASLTGGTGVWSARESVIRGRAAESRVGVEDTLKLSRIDAEEQAEINKLWLERDQAMLKASQEYASMAGSAKEVYSAQLQLLEIERLLATTTQERAVIEEKIAQVTAQRDEDWTKGVKDGLKDVERQQTSFYDAARQGMVNFQSTAKGVWVNWVTTGKLSINDIKTTFLAAMAEMAYQRTLGKALSAGLDLALSGIGNLFGGSTMTIDAGSTPNQTLTQSHNYWSGQRAEGGPVSAGSMYLVGERGPEPFIPNTSGTIVSHERAREIFGGGGGQVITINAPVTVNASGGTQEQNADLAKQMGKQVTNEMRALVRDEIAQQLRPRGSLYGRA